VRRELPEQGRLFESTKNMAKSASKAIHLSVVATSRNDNHGGYLTLRMQHFVDGFVAQCRRHDLRAELILVEWNPPPHRRPLIEELKWPMDLGPCEIRIITVPCEVHARLPHGDKLPLFQMIAKNVGIRRAHGRFVLATNIDILFSDEAILFMRDKLQPGCLYRADRCDVPTEVPTEVPFDEVLDFCRRETFRIHATGFILVKQPNGRWRPSSPWAAIRAVIWRGAIKSVWQIPLVIGRQLGLVDKPPAYTVSLTDEGTLRRVLRYLVGELGSFYRFVRDRCRSVSKVAKWIYHALLKRELFTNACGDFTLLSKEDWESLRGYLEWPMYSLHLDSVIVHQANRNGVKEVYLGKEACVYHIEHAPGSGFTPESSDKLFARLDAQGIPYLDWEKDIEPMIRKMDLTRAAGSKVIYNEENWGYAGLDFQEASPAAVRMEAANP